MPKGTILDNWIVKKIVSRLPYLLKVATKIIGLSLIACISCVQAQQVNQINKTSKTPQAKQKVVISTNKQAGIRLQENSLNQSSKGMSLNPELFKRTEGEYSNDGGAN